MVRWEFRLSCRVEPFAASDAATSARTATGRIGRVRDSISRRGEGMGSLECRHAAPQWRRLRQGSVLGDAGGPSAFDALSSLELSIDPARLQRGDHASLSLRGMFERFEEVAKVGGILRVRVLFPGILRVSVLL